MVIRDPIRQRTRDIERFVARQPAAPHPTDASARDDEIRAVKNREPFISIWRQLSSSERREVISTSLKGRRAADPFQAWLVVEFVTTNVASPARWAFAVAILASQAVLVAAAWIDGRWIDWVGLIAFVVLLSAITFLTLVQLHARTVNRMLMDLDEPMAHPSP
jgi:hypothetical protein